MAASKPSKGGSGIRIKKSHEGRLHKALGVPAGQPIPAAKLAAAKNSKDSAIRKMATFADNAKGFNHSGGTKSGGAAKTTAAKKTTPKKGK